MKFQYISPYHKKLILQDKLEEKLLRQSRYRPNDIVYYKNRPVKLMYGELREDVLVWFVKAKSGWYFLPEAELH